MLVPQCPVRRTYCHTSEMISGLYTLGCWEWHISKLMRTFLITIKIQIDLNDGQTALDFQKTYVTVMSDGSS
jgi:hypothetical protein